MRKIVLATMLVVTVMFTGCSAKPATKTTPDKAAENTVTSDNTQQNKNDAIISSETDTKRDETQKTKNAAMQMICSEPKKCMTDTGYYYITEDTAELSDGSEGYRLMYMDFKTKQEIFLCNELGCKHNNKNCTAVLTEEDFGNECLIFQANSKLYIVSRNIDMENSANTVTYYTDDADDLISFEQPSSNIVSVYSMGLDGTKRTKEYSFEPDIMVEHSVLSDGKNLYFVTKKLSVETDKDTSYYTATKHQLEMYSPDSHELKNVLSLDFNDNIRWTVAGCSGKKIIISGIKYNKNLSLKEEYKLSKEDAAKHIQNSKTIYASIAFSDDTPKEIWVADNGKNGGNSAIVHGNFLYVSDEKEQKIWSIDLNTGKKKQLASLKQSCINSCLSDTLCCTSWNISKDHSLYFVDLKTGKVNHCTLVNKCNGWDIEIKGETGDEVLAIYDYDATKESNEIYDIKKYQYGLINKNDLYQSHDKFKKINMKGKGI